MDVVFLMHIYIYIYIYVYDFLNFFKVFTIPTEIA